MRNITPLFTALLLSAACFFSTIASSSASSSSSSPATPGSATNLLGGQESGKFLIKRQAQQNGLQTEVEWDKHSLFINGERTMIWSGEFHPWRLPVTDLWIDILQKVKALGFNCISFYMHWGIVEPAKGEFDFEYWRSFDPFFAAAKEVGLYLIARPGPYINAETTGGGLPGWGTRVKGPWRSGNQSYLDAMSGYVDQVGKIISAHEIAKGGSIILVQIENEFSGATAIEWPQPKYMQTLMDSYNKAGVTIPFILNDLNPYKHDYIPGTGEGAVDIYGYDAYPLGFDCSNPANWHENSLPYDFWALHVEYNNNTQNAILEMQGGSFDPWGGSGYDKCAELLSNQFERVFYKDLMSFSTTLINLYMIYGGTNWGGIPHPGVYTSYDYGSVIDEARLITKEKYSELKLEAQFLKVSPAYLTTEPSNAWPGTMIGAFSNTQDIAITRTADVVGNKTVFWITKHANYTSTDHMTYKLKIPTSHGELEIPQLQGDLTLGGRDSKVHVSDYDIGNGKTILYSTGEIMTWKTFGNKTVVVLYGDYSETHETAFTGFGDAECTSVGLGLNKCQSSNGTVIINYTTDQENVIQIGSDLVVYTLDRPSAYGFWVPDLPEGTGNNASYSTANSVLVKGTYLIRSATVDGSTVSLKGDLTSDATIEVFANQSIDKVKFNGNDVEVTRTSYGALTGKVTLSTPPSFTLPDLKSVEWKWAGSLPEVTSSNYDDSKWPNADITVTPNTYRKITTPVSLYSGDYGFHTGNILFRGHFEATGTETDFTMTIQGGTAFGCSVWLNSDHIGGFAGTSTDSYTKLSLSLPKLSKGSKNVITVLQDHMGMEESGAGSDDFKTPRGILDYAFTGSSGTTVTWKITGNFGGEHGYIDRVRGALNEGGLYAERKGYHLPGFDDSKWEKASPLNGYPSAGVAFFRTTFDLNLPKGYDIPIDFIFTNTTQPSDFRAQLYVNGYKFGKYVNNIGPQKAFPVPEGILNYRGHNTVAVSLWALDSAGAKLGGLEMKARAVVQTSLNEIKAASQPAWTTARNNAY